MARSLYFLLLLALLIYHNTSEVLSAGKVGGARSFRRELIEALEAKKGKYESNALPDVKNLTVTMQFYIYCLFGLDDREVMEMTAWMGLTWQDYRFQWNPFDYDNISTVEMSADHLWLPDVSIWNAKEPENADLRTKTIRTLTVNPQGMISVFLPMIVNIPCPIDSILFPFDQQICRVKLGTVNSPRSYYQLKLGGVNFKHVKTTLVGEWSPVGYRKNLTSSYYAPGDTYFDVYHVDIILDRKPLYHIVLVIIPFVLLTIIALVMFLAQEAGDRVSISIAIVLAMTLYIMITSQNAPKSMQKIPLLGVYLMIQMSLLIIFTFIGVMSAISPNMVEAEVTSTPQKSFWRSLRDNRKCMDTVAFIVYLVLTVMNSGVCLILVPFVQVKHKH